MMSFITFKYYDSLNIIKMIKSRRMKWKGHAARIGDKGRSKAVPVL
jgi:hypothetical protein